MSERPLPPVTALGMASLALIVAGGIYLSAHLPEHVPLIQKHMLAACDAKDGVADGIITDPRSCTWDPGELACKGAASADCLTQAQVETVRRRDVSGRSWTAGRCGATTRARPCRAPCARSSAA